jgi:ribosomal protein S18 acetylase RimI-like enzyme
MIRPARRDDAAAIIGVRVASWNAAYAAHLPADAWDDYDLDAAAQRLADSIEAGSTRVLVAASGDGIVGYSIFGAVRDDDLRDGTSEVYSIYVHPDAWSTGAGRDLMSETLAVLHGRLVVLWVLEDNHRARRFYELAGFVADGNRKHAEMPGGPVPEVRYRRG